MGTSTNVVVRWRTSWSTTTLVRYGLQRGSLDRVVGTPGKLRDHVVLLSGLSPGTKYYYAIGSSNRVLQSGPSNYFITAPAPGSVQPIRIWVLGDPGTGYPEQYAVRDSYQRLTGSRPTDLILVLGDNAYRDGTDFQYQSYFFDVYRDWFKHAVVWPTLGNHDARSADSRTETGVYYDIFTLPRFGQAGGIASGTGAYYSFDYGNVHFICLNSEDSDLSPGGPMVNWLKRDLVKNQSQWLVAFWHQPPYSKGTHDSDSTDLKDSHMTEMRERVVPVLEAGGVDLVLCGHSHLYERSYLLRGHYGPATSFRSEMIRDGGDGRPEGRGAYRKPTGRSETAAGTVYVNSGSAGHATSPGDLRGLNHPVMCVSLNVPGSFVLDIAGARLDAVFLDDHGVQLDHFTLLKEGPTPSAE